MTALLQVRDLVKHYPGVCAVDHVSFDIEAGACFGLLGPNGAGKTTAIEMMEGINPPSAGAILYRGEALGRRFRAEAGIQFQRTALQDFLTVRETLELFVGLYSRTTDLDRLIELCSLEEFLQRDTRKLSGGQRQRLLLAIALVNDPQVVFLDEPTTGLDPQSRHNFWQLVGNIKAAHKTVILTTHYMEEAYYLCDDIAIMDHGKIIARGAPTALLEQHFEHTFLRLPGKDFGVAKDRFPLPYLEQNGYIEIHTRDVNEAVGQLLHYGIPLSRLEVRPPTLEDLFLELTGKELRG